MHEEEGQTIIVDYDYIYWLIRTMLLLCDVNGQIHPRMYTYARILRAIQNQGPSFQKKK